MTRRLINAIRCSSLLAAGLLILHPGTAHSGPWPRFLGPNQDSTAPNERLPAVWPSKGPEKVWQRRVGSGFSGPIVSQNRVILFQREGNSELIVSLDPKTGEEQWRFSYPTRYRDQFGFDNGPRATPTASDGRLYTYGAEGRLQCVDLVTGRPIWHVDAQKAYSAPNGFFGIACSPHVEGELVIVNVGNPQNAGIVAFDRLSGTFRWKTSRDEASYASPVGATIAGIRQVVFFDRAGLKAVQVPSGRIRAQYPWRPQINASVNAASPLVRGNQVLLTTSYNRGAIVLDLTQTKPRKIWSNDESISCHYGTPVLSGDSIYGFHGRQEWGATLNCVDWNTGKVRWRTERVEIGTLILADRKLLILQETGELILAKADPSAYQELDRAQILPSGVRAYPALSDGVLYARSPKQMVAYRVGSH